MISTTILGSVCHLAISVYIWWMVFVPPENCPEWKVSKKDKWIAIGFISFFMLCFVLSWVFYALGRICE